MLKLQRAGSIAFASDYAKHDMQAVRVPERLTNTGLSNSIDLIVDYSTKFMKELAFV